LEPQTILNIDTSFQCSEIICHITYAPHFTLYQLKTLLHGILTYRNNGCRILSSTGSPSPNPHHCNRPPITSTCARVWPLHFPGHTHCRPRAVGHVRTLGSKHFDPPDDLERLADLRRYLDRGHDTGVPDHQVGPSINPLCATQPTFLQY
jgi:hypothetical protein